ncbi:hypothetical protein BOTBODRAFT_29666 [Botryobasidium botryosum FD-172 SS1]|uniref:N-acetyltransferase domain-containing protein n=1 Tax=Botryobasidium botryosum (strain FD-172 SS1) TaxID=930990 RepID=A0A067MP08_BOTB1|nr:hypothetical protein BOTBODRAFT_29666 [Botryobasidium botryosum FD-172 SS1]
MRTNERTAVVAPTLVLVPYRPEHVTKYHGWMTDPDLLNLTASEPLTLAQEIDMQQKWHMDEDKLTFIVLARPHPSVPLITSDDIRKHCPMIGDVNLFFKPGDAETESEVECEVMIAEPAYRRNGHGHTALRLLLLYASAPPLAVNPRNFVARIGAKNEPSIALFKKLGFALTKYVEAFDEVEMRFGHGRSERQSGIGREFWMGGGIGPELDVREFD